MKKRLSELLLPALLLPFCLGGTTVKEKAGYYQPAYFPALTRGDDVYSFQLTYQYTKTVHMSELKVYMNVYNPYGAGAKHIDIETFYVEDAYPGDDATFRVKIDYDLFSTENKRNLLYISAVNPGYLGEVYSFYLNYSTNAFIYIEKENSSYERPYEGHYESFSSVNKVQNIIYEWKGFAGDYEDPKYMLLPLSQLKIRMKNSSGVYKNLPLQTATLNIYDTENYRMGTRMGGGSSARVIVELAWTYDSSHYTKFKAKRAIIYSPDYRIVRQNGEETVEDHLSYSIFLPPVPVGEVRTTEFMLELRGAGEYGKDTIFYHFETFQTHNYVGSLPISEWYVEER